MRLLRISVISSLVILAFAGELRIQGPISDLFIGDSELFTCSGPKSLFSNLTWQYEFSDGHLEAVTSSDISEDKIIFRDTESSIMRKSYIRMKSKDIQKLHCYGTETHSNDIRDVASSLDLIGFKQIDSLEEPICEEAPKIILRRWDDSFKSQYWVSHYVTNQGVDISSDRVTGLKVTCLSSQRIKWFTTKDLKGFQYWTSDASANEGCYSAILVLSPFTSLSSQKFICGQDKKGTYVDIKMMGPIRSNEIDFNKTQECIEHLGTTIFGNQALTWTTTGASLLSVGMMVGIVFLKKQLDRQKEINNQPSGPSPVTA